MKNYNIYRLLRIANNKTKEEIANELSISLNLINKIEEGTEKPSKELRVKYAKVLGIDEKNIEIFEDEKSKNFSKKILLWLLALICKVK